MPSGFNITISVWRFTSIDDEDGGSVPSGTVTYANLPSRRIDRLLRSRKLPELDMLDQGLETTRYNLFMLTPANIDVQENDEIQIVAPSNHQDYLKFFRIITLAREGYSPSDPRGYMIASTKRSVRSHAIQ